MTAQALMQNFRGMRALLWCSLGTQRGALQFALEPPLRKLGVGLAAPEALNIDVMDSNRDLLLIDGDCDLDAGDVLLRGAACPPIPVIGLVGVEAPSRLKALVALGATAFLRKPIHGAAVYASLFLAINGFHRLRSMEHRLADQDRRRRGRRFVVKAVVYLTATQGVTDDEAYEFLRRESMRTRQGIEEYCEALLVKHEATGPLTLQSKKGTNDETRVNDGRGDGGRDRSTDRGGTGRRSDQVGRA